MMLRILRDKFIRLGRDDDGVAMVTTLAVFMFMYLFCIGVYAIGTAVKTRVHLQNACDAAAYSAAVVQADTLSRIATLNRAMAWTYIALTRRQMDYIVWKWLDHAQKHVYEDANAVISSGSPGAHMHPYWYVGGGNVPVGTLGYNLPFSSLANLSINGDVTSILQVRAATTGFRGIHLPGEGDSFYSSLPTISGLKKQIDDDKQTIEEMNRAENVLIDMMPKRIKAAAESVFMANCDPSWKVGSGPRLFQCDNPRMEYMRILDGSKRGLKEEELWFLSFAKYFPSDAGKPFDKGSGASEWFPLTGSGIKRSYKQRKKLYAEWYSWSCAWVCPELTPCYFTSTTPSCGHNCEDCKSGSCDRCNGWPVRHAYLEAEHLRPDKYPDKYKGRDLYEGVTACPLVLQREYFGKSGTITVAVSVENQNPWYSIFKTTIKGIFSAFNIGGANSWTPQYTVCIASAKAGYKYLGEDVENDKRGYRISWEEDVDWKDAGQSWNLCQSDWDAVLIPVRRAESFAKWKGGDDAVWDGDGDVGGFLEGYLSGIAPPNEMLAGGPGKGVDEFYAGRDLGEEYRFGTIGGDGAGFWRGANLPDYRSTGNVNMKWRIGKPNNPIKWGEIQKVMFH